MVLAAAVALAARRPLNCPKIKVNEKRERGPCGLAAVALEDLLTAVQILQRTAFLLVN